MTPEAEVAFELVVALPAQTLAEGALLDVLFEAGCDDAVIGLGAGGSWASPSRGQARTPRP